MKETDAMSVAIKMSTDSYNEGRKDIIEGIRKLEEENYCPVFEMEGMQCIHWNDNCGCISCYLDRIEELDKEKKNGNKRNVIT